jgi:ABC-type phosphate/phosphonate transport system permease subunit
MADETLDTSATPAAPAAPEAPKKRNLVPILIVVGVIVIVIIAGVAYKLTKSSSDKKASGPLAGAVAKHLFKSWQSGDQTAAAKWANPNAVSQMFAIKSSDGTGLVFGGCTADSTGPFPKKCVWSRPGGQLTLTVNRANGTTTVTKVDLGSAATTPTT